MAASTRHKPLVYRLEEITTVESKEDLLLLFPPEFRDRMTVTSLSPSINLDRRTSTATISFLPLSEEPFPTPSEQDICVDQDFYGFTPLYTPEGNIDVDIIAITGLAGHAFGSWSTATQRMWLRDFLPRDIPQARILLYGYDSHIVNSQSRSILADFSSNFIVKFNAMRGCLMINEVLINLGSYFDHRRGSIRPTVRSIIFFGAPHRGLEIATMQSMVQGTPSEDLIRELRMRSPTLERLNDGFRRVFEDVDILTIFEMEPTASLRMDESNAWERTGPPVMMVEKDSAILYWSNETRIGLNQDHSRIAKVDRGQNGCYDDLCHFLQQSLISTDKTNTMPIVNARVLSPSALPSSTGKANIVPTVKARSLDSSALPASSKSELDICLELCKAIQKGHFQNARDLVRLVEKGLLAKLSGLLLSVTVQDCPELVSTLLDAGADISARDEEKGSQVIHTAGQYATSPDTVQLLLDAGAEVNAKDYTGGLPLHYAAVNNNNPETIQVLIDADATVNAPDNNGCTPLHCAAANNGNPSILQVLINVGATVNVPNNDGCTPLHSAAAHNQKPQILQVLIDAGATVNALNNNGFTPLHSAAAYNQKPQIVQVLIDAGATVNAPDNNGFTPLHEAAAKNQNPQSLQVLIDAGAEVNVKDYIGRLPLHYAAVNNNNPETIQVLIDAGATVNAPDKYGFTLLHYAAAYSQETKNKNPEICRELLTAGADPKQVDNDGYTALYWAIKEGNKVVVRHLLEFGADPRSMSRNVVAPKDLDFHDKVPPATRNEIREMITKATRRPERRAQVENSKNRYNSADLSLDRTRRPS
ncbi:MAG: hypothetical protein ASARMPREDX12_006341 [Alectoria sarmentosa]|nr:MAG: hypothetical protein ASARMPREDX12_006341 [Alectoria sarmentosa]